MAQTVIITSKYYKTVASVVCGTSEQITAIVSSDPQAHGFLVKRPSDWEYRGEVIDLANTATNNACQDILNGVAALPQDRRYLL